MYLIYCTCSCWNEDCIVVFHCHMYRRVMCELMLIHGETFSVDQQADLSKTCLFGNLEYDFSSTVCAV